MTIHRLIRCDFDQVAAATDEPGRSSVNGPHGRTLRWPTQVLGTTIWCTLEMEQGANGVLAHFFADRPQARRAGRLERAVLDAWTARALTRVALSAERAGRTVPTGCTPSARVRHDGPVRRTDPSSR